MKKKKRERQNKLEQQLRELEGVHLAPSPSAPALSAEADNTEKVCFELCSSLQMCILCG